MRVFWDITPCSLVVVDWRFRGAFITLMMEAVRISETSVYPEETTRRFSQKTLIFTLDAVRIWNLTTVMRWLCEPMKFWTLSKKRTRGMTFRSNILLSAWCCHLSTAGNLREHIRCKHTWSPCTMWNVFQAVKPLSLVGDTNFQRRVKPQSSDMLLIPTFCMQYRTTQVSVL
jgi:hypothetical protein